jgi:Domain of unknown function (DUF4118)
VGRQLPQGERHPGPTQHRSDRRSTITVHIDCVAVAHPTDAMQARHIRFSAFTTDSGGNADTIHEHRFREELFSRLRQRRLLTRRGRSLPNITATAENVINRPSVEIVLVNVIAILVASILALAGQVVAGRLVGLSITAVCSAAMAYFLMPPVFSLRISQTSDLFALAFYGSVGLVIAKSGPSRQKRIALREEPIRNIPPLKQPEADVRAVMTELMSSDLGVRLRAEDIAIEAASFGLPGPCGDALRMLTDVITRALQGSGIRRISVYGGKRPGVQHLVVAAHRVWPPPLYKVITIGKRDEDCEAAVFLGWPSHSHASWFDNGYDRIYQVSVEVAAEAHETVHRDLERHSGQTAVKKFQRNVNPSFDDPGSFFLDVKAGVIRANLGDINFRGGLTCTCETAKPPCRRSKATAFVRPSTMAAMVFAPANSGPGTCHMCATGHAGGGWALIRGGCPRAWQRFHLTRLCQRVRKLEAHGAERCDGEFVDENVRGSGASRT